MTTPIMPEWFDEWVKDEPGLPLKENAPDWVKKEYDEWQKDLEMVDDPEEFIKKK